MYKNQSSICNSVEQRYPLSEVEMQLLTRRVVMNLTKSAMQTHAKVLPSAVGSVGTKKFNDSFLQNYSTARPKQKLLRFPAFPLEETLAKFLKTTEPLLDEAEMKQTREAAQKFLECDGAQLQKILEEVAAKEENWLATRWLRTAYMQYRDPVTVFSSPGMTFPLQSFSSDEEYLAYTAKVIFVLIKYKQMVDNGEIPVQKMGKFELDNSQFERVFGTCRVPKIKEDFLEYNPDSKHVAVIYKNSFYKLPVFSKSGKPIHPDALVAELRKIMQTEKVKGPAFGILSSDNRDNWAASYSELITIPGNQKLVKTIQKSLFTVSLDQEVPMEVGKNDMNVMSEQLIHGGGSDQNSGNRWFDKTIQVIVNRNGLSGFCYEHSPAEGQPIALMTDFVVKNLNNESLYADATCDFEGTKKLLLKSSPCLDKLIETAKENVNKLACDLQMHVLHYKGYGKGFLKQQKLSPDSFIQMAIQYAFYKLHKVPGAGYESAHLRMYVNGRTETIRSCSNESIAFAKAMCSSDCTDEQRVELLRKAVNGHREYTSMALQGRGVDRHLLGLKLMAVEKKLPVPEFYKCPGVVKSAHFRLSTSQVAATSQAFMCYGPLTSDGYACCYNPRENDIFLSLAAWRSNSETCADRFAVSMREALDTMMEVLGRAGEKPSAKL